MTTIPVPPEPAYDAELDAIFQSVVVGVLGFDPTLVRPRWQPYPPKEPEVGVDWCAIGVLSSIPDAFPYIAHLSQDNITDPSADQLWRHEELEVLASFYGSNAMKNLGYLRDGLTIVQNTEVLEANQIAFVGAEEARTAPEFINQQWRRRFDLPLIFRRKIQRVYSMPNILDASVHLFDDSGHVDDTINVPPDGREPT